MNLLSTNADRFVRYNTTPRMDILEVIEEQASSPSRVLSLGTGCGATERVIKRLYGSYVVGLEINDDAAKCAARELDEVIVADVETYEFPSETGFDLIVCSDVLEHLRNPGAVLAKLKSVLQPNGVVIICVPNVRYWHVLYTLVVKADWPSRDSGIFDKTHLRWFTRKSLCRMVESTGYEILEMRRKVRSVASTPIRRVVEKFIRMLLPRDFAAYQFLVIARNRRKAE